MGMTDDEILVIIKRADASANGALRRMVFTEHARADVLAVGNELLETRRQLRDAQTANEAWLRDIAAEIEEHALTTAALREAQARLERLCRGLDEEGALYALAAPDE